jgi:hypothetical protein
MSILGSILAITSFDLTPAYAAPSTPPHPPPRLENQSYTLNWGLGSDSALQVAGVDWGVQCYQLQVDYCNGDNR